MISTSYTLAEAKEMLEEWKKCERALVSGTVMSYKVGSRECTMIDLDDIRAAIRYFANICEALSGKVRTTRVSRVVPRDL